MFTVDLQPVGRRVQAAPGETLLEIARNAGIELSTVCGGIGVCNSCRVRLIAGKLSAPTLEEEAAFRPEALAAGWRLACQAEPRSAVTVEIPAESLTAPQRLQIEGQGAALALDPLITTVPITLEAPHLGDLRADDLRLRDALLAAGCGAVQMPLAVLRTVPNILRAQAWRGQAVLHRNCRLVTLLPEGLPIAGLAVDVGTTSIAAYLLDLQTGVVLAKAGAMNPQIAYGEDVVSRIRYLNDSADSAAHAGINILRARLLDTLNNLLAQLCAEAGLDGGQVVDAVIVGNTAMHHIFADLPVQQLGEAPYVPAVSAALELSSAEAGLKIAPGAGVYLPPNIAGYVGADHSAMLAAVRIWDAQETTLALDIGTNTEVTLAHGGRYYTCSCASGPAFEGAHIRDGMRAAAGAIERVHVLNGAVKLETIHHEPPVGICGSGILDAVAVMVQLGVVDGRGALRAVHRHVDQIHGETGFVLAGALESGHGRPVLVTRKDVAEIQLAKAAIRAGIEVLLDAAGITAQAVERFVIAGAFGSYINVESAVRIGMFPALPLERFEQVGNAAGIGATHLLLSRELRARVAALTAEIQYLELTAEADFEMRFIEQMAF